MFKALKEKLVGWKKKAPEEVLEVVSGEGGKRIKREALDEYLHDLELALLESDVAFPVVEEITTTLEDELLGKRITREVSFEAGMDYALRRAVEKILAAPGIDLVEFIRAQPKPVVLMFVGVNGTGKTTTIAKIAHLLQRQGILCIMAAADTFRAGAIEQLEEHGRRLGIRVVKHQAGGDPAAVAYDAVEHAKAKGIPVVLIDTAGRMQTKQNLMDQMKKIKRVANPHLVIFVGDALAGNDAVEQARGFQEAVGIDGIVLTKIDADAKGGAALSITHTVGKPILFLSTGQGYEDMVAFNPTWMAERLLERE